MMSTKKDKERATTEPFRNEAKVKIKCVFPPCPVQIEVDKPPEGMTAGSPQHMAQLGGIPLCPKHGEMLGFYIWCQQSIRLEAQKTAGGLVLPGHETFKATMGAAPGKVR